MRESDDRHTGWRAGGAIASGALLAGAALALAALLWVILGAGHAQAQRADVPETSVLEGEGVSPEAAFGTSLALSADGSTAIVGAPRDSGHIGSVWVFTRSGSTWVQQAKLTAEEAGGSSPPCGEEAPAEAEECGFGRSVALSADGNVALIGSPRNEQHVGAAWVFTRSGSTWTRSSRLTGGEAIGSAHFGRSVALSADAATAIVGGGADSAGHGAAWVFSHSGTAWTQQAKLTAPAESGQSFFGASVALSRSGDAALVGAPGDEGSTGAAWLFSRSGGTWTAQSTPLVGSEEVGEGRFGLSVALSAEGTTALVGGRTDNERVGAAWAFANAGGSWEQQGPKLTGGSEEVEQGAFGFAVALSASGDEALIGGPANAHGPGAAWLFKRSGAAYSQQGAIITGGKGPSADRLGTAVALSQTGAEGLIGAPHTNEQAGNAIALFGIAVPAPTVTSVTPNAGPSAGGTPVTVEGSGFLPGAKVTIGGEASAVEVISETKLKAVTSATPAGAREVVVQDEYGTSTGGPSFTYEAAAASGTPETTTQTQTTSSGAQGVLGSAAVVVPAPVLAVSGNIEPVSGTVFVRLPGSSQFVPLTGLRQIPFGTIVDARKGKVTITTMGPHGLQTITLYEGEFVLTQNKKGLVVATLYGGTFSGCPTARERAHRARAAAHHGSRKHVVRKLWASGHGSYSTKGNYATGAVIGTVWLTVDRCDGTLIRVSTDKVLVTNLVTHKRVRVKAGHSYFAKAR